VPRHAAVVCFRESCFCDIICVHLVAPNMITYAEPAKYIHQWPANPHAPVVFTVMVQI
jgi:hypothetical protein